MKTLIRVLLVALLISTIGSQHALAQTSGHASAVPSPVVDAGDYVYISAQGPRRADGSLPATFAEQVRQTLENLEAVVKSAGLSVDHVVYTQVYLEDMGKYGEMNTAFAGRFGKTPPARAVLGVAKLPDPSIAITAVVFPIHAPRSLRL